MAHPQSLPQAGRGSHLASSCSARHALEYQGTGHHQGSAAARDAVKKEALRKAGVGYHEVVAGHTTPKELRLLVEKLVPESG